MSAEPEARLVAALTQVLEDETRHVREAPDARARLRRRIDEGASARRSRRVPGWRGPVAAAVALALVAVCLVLATTGGLHRAATPAPALTPTAVPPTTYPTPTTRPSSTAPGGFRPSRPRVAWTLYRPGSDGLYVDAARASAPYDPVQAMDALFQQAATVPGAVTVPHNDLNRVASLTYVDDVVHLDMASVDDVTRPSAADARRWVDAWVQTAADALGTYGLVQITLDGRPTTLYGVVDTSRPFFARTEVKHPAAVFFPAASERVTSPAAVAAMPGAVGDRLVVSDARTGDAVATVTADASGGGRTVLTAAPDLGPGEYTVSLRQRSGQVVEQRRFTVTGSAPTGAREPVTDPPTTEVASTLVYFPGPDGHLLAEPRPRTTLAAAVTAISGEPVGEGASWPFGSMGVGTVVERDGEVVVDYVSDDKVRPGNPDDAVAEFWVQSLVHTVAAYVGRPVPVRITLGGASFRVFDRLATTEPFAYRPVDERLSTGLAEPTAVPGPSPLVVVGAVAARGDGVTWYVSDVVSHETLYQGRADVRDDRTYGFALPLPPGRYDLRVDVTTVAGKLSTDGRGIEVT